MENWALEIPLNLGSLFPLTQSSELNMSYLHF